MAGSLLSFCAKLLYNLQEVAITVIVVKTSTTVTSCNQLERLSALIIHLSRRVYNSSFENLEEAQPGDR